MEIEIVPEPEPEAVCLECGCGIAKGEGRYYLGADVSYCSPCGEKKIVIRNHIV